MKYSNPGIARHGQLGSSICVILPVSIAFVIVLVCWALGVGQ